MAAAQSPVTPLVRFDAAALAEVFGRKPMLVEHELLGERLLQLEALADLAGDLPQTLEFVEHHRGDAGELVPGGGESAPRLAVSGVDVVRSIETNQCRMSLRHIELVPRYAELMDRVLDGVAPLIPERDGRMRQREGFVFVNAPNSITPLHADPEHNFLLQTRGTKTVRIGTFADQSRLDLDLERQYGGGHHYLTTMPDELVEYALRPGIGLYIPPHVAHMVENGDEASVSLSVTFRTAATKRGENVYRFNARLRKLRLQPHPPGDSKVVDVAKAATVRAWKRARSLASGLDQR